MAHCPSCNRKDETIRELRAIIKDYEQTPESFEAQRIKLWTVFGLTTTESMLLLALRNATRDNPKLGAALHQEFFPNKKLSGVSKSIYKTKYPALRVHMSNIRRKLEEKECIGNVTDFGYYLTPEGKRLLEEALE